MKITCPKCGNVIVVNGIGRRRLPIAFNIVSKAFQLNRKGKPALTKMAMGITRETGIKVSPAFVLFRLREEAVDRGLTYDGLVAQIMTKGKKDAPSIR